jgi:hypothetical protein
MMKMSGPPFFYPLCCVGVNVGVLPPGEEYRLGLSQYNISQYNISEYNRKVKVKQSRYRHGVAQMVPGS